MSDSWAGVAVATIRKHIREVEDNVMRDNKLLAKLQADGRVTFGWTGDDCDWRIRFKRAVPKGYADMDATTAPRRNRRVVATLPWRGYSLDESLSKLDSLKNRSTEAIVKLLSTIVPDMTDDFEEHFGTQLYIDGNASGNGKLIHGIESFMSVSGADGDGFIGVNDDTYAGLSTALGAKGGSWTGNWPVGTSTTPEYDYFTPLVVDYTDTAWTASTKTWPNTCEEALNFAIIHTAKNKSKKGRANIVLITNEMYRQFRDKIRGREQINVTQGGGGKGNSLTGLGFGEVINYEGAEVSFEFNVPADTGYGFNTAHMELRSMQDTLFDFNTKGRYEPGDKTWRFSMDFFGNMCFNPRYFFKLKNIT